MHKEGKWLRVIVKGEGGKKEAEEAMAKQKGTVGNKMCSSGGGKKHFKH